MGVTCLSRIITLALVLSFCGNVLAQTRVQASADNEVREPVLLKADQLRDEQKLGLVVATGNVEFSQGSRTLLADTVTYNRRTNVVSAAGNVSLLEPTGEVMFAEHAELTGDLRNGIVEQIRVRLTDDARIAAAGGKRSNGNRTEFAKAVYSPCKLCEKNPSRAPTWQLKGFEVVHDQTSKDIVYKDAALVLFGIPVLYTPYLSHPDSTVDRRSGILTPSYGSNTELGQFIRTPYYFAIAPNMDATVTPLLTSNEGTVYAGEFRHRLNRGYYDVSGSGIFASSTNGGSNGFRGHVKSKFRFDINRTWRSGSDILLPTDDTYLRRYGFEDGNTLVNRLFAEGFHGRNYTSAKAYYFQGQRSDDHPSKKPFVLPMLDYNAVGDPGRLGGQWKFDANFLHLARTDSSSSMRASFKPTWELPYISEGGHVYRAFATVQADAYLVKDVVEPDASSRTLSGLTGRVFPQLGLDWRLPMSRSLGTITHVFEPIVGIIAAPGSQNFEKIPNDDSLSVELDENNFMSANRFSGLDRVEGGTRVNYGISTGVYGLTGGTATFFIGQSYRLTDESDFGQGTGLKDHFSDIVGRLNVSPLRYVQANFRFRLDKDDFSANRREISVEMGVPSFKVGMDYLLIEPGEELGAREGINLLLTSRLTDRWYLGFNTMRNLKDGGHSVNSGIFARYEDDCFVFQVDYTRDFTRDRDLVPSDTILFRFVLKNLGEFATPVRTLN